MSIAKQQPKKENIYGSPFSNRKEGENAKTLSNVMAEVIESIIDARVKIELKKEIRSYLSESKPKAVTLDQIKKVVEFLERINAKFGFHYSITDHHIVMLYKDDLDLEYSYDKICKLDNINSMLYDESKDRFVFNFKQLKYEDIDQIFITKYGVEI